ncbi:TIGR03089 family protein [Pseudactinotalea sp.]|uniref:TIGR03089 family protein n=1 Tax=Pseudactinotalea sp. TaxID=1926260 RepID=UPI003B3A8562
MTPPVLATLSRWEPSSPRLTWYGEADERVELSGRVLTNWVVKAANLLVSECAVAPASIVQLDLPAHWRLLVWALGAWSAGAEVVLEPEDAAPDVVVTDSPDRWLDGAAVDLVAVTLPALGRAWPGPLPAGVIDGAAELMGQPDQPMFAVPQLRGGATTDGGERVLLLAEDPTRLVEQAWACWSEGGSAVVVTPRDQAALDSIRAQEGIGARPTAP